MRKYLIVFAMLFLSASLFATDYDYSFSSDEKDVSFTSGDRVLQPVSLNLKENGTSYFEIGFKQDGNVSTAPVALTVGGDNVGRGSVNVYWNISSSDAYTVKLAREKALATTTSATGSEKNSIDWQISSTDNQQVISDGSTVTYTETVNIVSSEGGAFLTKENLEGTAYYIYTETLDAESGYVAGDYNSNLVLTITT